MQGAREKHLRQSLTSDLQGGDLRMSEEAENLPIYVLSLVRGRSHYANNGTKLQKIPHDSKLLSCYFNGDFKIVFFAMTRQMQRVESR